MIRLTHNSYGKSRVRLTKVTRHAVRHDLKELTVDVELEGDFEDAYTRGDNSRIIATDTMKNTVYALARHHPIDTIEAFSIHLASHFTRRFEQVTGATIRIAGQVWDRITEGGAPHPNAFVGGHSEERVCIVRHTRTETQVNSGFENLLVLTTANSSFSGFTRDEYTTLPETDDRILATSVTALWTYDDADLDWEACFSGARGSMLRTFAEHESRSVQETLYKMGEAALEACPQMREITLHLPNSHRLLVPLEPLGLDNPNEIFVPSPEPYGIISGTLKRA